MPKSRCSTTKFIKIIKQFFEEKEKAIIGLGFGGLLKIGCIELRSGHCNWLLENYEVGYHRLHLSQQRSITIKPQHISMVLGIPCDGLDINVHNRRSTPNRTYKMKVVETNLGTLLVGEDFCKSFLIFACVTILAPNSKHEGIWDLWDSIMASDCTVKRNWAKFVLQYLEDGIHEFQRSESTYLRGCIIFLHLFYLSYTTIPLVSVELTCPL